MNWKKLSSEYVHKNPFYKVRMDDVIRPDGKKGKYYVMESPPSVFIVALDEEDHFYLIKQERYTTGIISWEVPAGGSEGEDLEFAARKELQEETGLEAQEWIQVSKFQSINGIGDEIGHVFLARELNETTKNKMNEEGITEIKKVSFDEAFEMIKKQEITDAQTISAILQVYLYLKSS